MQGIQQAKKYACQLCRLPVIKKTNDLFLDY